MREIKFRAWEKNTKNKYHKELKNFRDKLYKSGKRIGRNRYEYESITLKMWEEESKKKYSDGVIEYYEMNYSPYLEDDECIGEFSLCDLNKCLKDESKVFMQYTGLKDKNGTEIYEGDVIEKETSDKPLSSSKRFCKVRYIVKWNEQKHDDNEHNNEVLSNNPSAFNERPCFYGKEIYNEKGFYCQDWSEFANCEVIGNIYEDSHLLK